MNHYADIHLRPDPEFSATVLMNALYGKLHRALAEERQNRVGVSFPAVKQQHALGTCLRLHGSQNDLETLMRTNWLAGMRDHIEVHPVITVPEAVRHRRVRRVQAHSSPERIVRRQMRRHGLSESEAKKLIQNKQPERLDLPFATLNSQSTGQRFCLFIEHGPISDRPTSGDFSSYGLSSRSTVPWF